MGEAERVAREVAAILSYTTELLQLVTGLSAPRDNGCVCASQRAETKGGRKDGSGE